MRLEGDSYGIHVGTFVMNYHHGLLRFGIVREKRTGDHGWAYCKVDWLEDDIHAAKVAWDKKMGARKIPSEEIRGEFLTPVSVQWIQNVLNAYGRYEDERRAEIG